MIKYKILTFKYNKGAQGLYIPKDIDKDLKIIVENKIDAVFNSMYDTNSFLHDITGSVKDGAFSINTIYLYREKEPNTGVILSVGDEISNTRVITIRRFTYDFTNNDIRVDINDTNYTRLEDIIELSSLSNFTKIKARLNDRVELFKLDTKQVVSTNTSKDLFDLKEIEEVLDKFLDKPEVQSALVEFKEYKVKKNSNTIESIAKPEESKYVLPEKFYFKLDTHGVLKKYPLKDYADLQTKDKSSILPF